MDPNNPVVKLCIEGLRLSSQGKVNEATAIFNKAWKTRTNDLEACIAAHFIAKQQKTLNKTLYWNLKALRLAQELHEDVVRDFFTSLYVNVADSYEKLGDNKKAKQYFDLAASSVSSTSLGSHGILLLDSIKRGQLRNSK